MSFYDPKAPLLKRGAAARWPSAKDPPGGVFLACMILFLCAFPLSARAAGLNFDYQFQNAENISSAFCAAYNINHQLESIVPLDINASSAWIPCDDPNLIDYLKIFTLDANSRPLAPARVIDHSPQSDHNTARIIQLNFQNPVITISCNHESEIDYILVKYNSAIYHSLFNRDFWNAAATDDLQPPSEYPQYYQIKNILQALMTSVDIQDGGGLGSVFDKYAAFTRKQQIAAYIRQTSADSAGNIIGAGHGILIQPGEYYPIDLGLYPMDENAKYIFLAVGRAPSGNQDAFRAVYPVLPPDKTPPGSNGVQSGLNMDIINGELADTCSGRVSLTFNEYLYYYHSSSNPPAIQPVDRGPVDSPDRQFNFISVGNLIQSCSDDSKINLVLREDLTNQRTVTIDLNFQHAKNGEFITFNPNLCDQFGNTRSVPLTVRVSLRRVRTIIDINPETGDPIYSWILTPVVEITPEWDGRI